MSSTTKSVRIREPDVFPPYAVRRLLAQLLSPSIVHILPHLLPEVPVWVKYVFFTLIIANIKSFPLLWHVRVLGAAVVARSRSRPSVHPLLPFIRSNKFATTMPGVTPRLRLDRLPLGRDIFTDKEVTLLRATPDDCDWNGHLSNSCYAKCLDQPRMAYLSSRFLRTHFDGANFALGGCSFVFHKEVPFMAKYEVEITIGAWDDKWLYVVARFLSPSPRSHLSSKTHQLARSKSAQNLKRLMADVVKPAHEAEAERRKAMGAKGQTGHEKEDEEKEKGKGKRDADKQTLYCTSISRYCFKAGRKTIPPWIVIATSGYGTYASTRTNWDKAEHLRRQTLQRTKAEYEERFNKPLPRDNLFVGSGYRKGGILQAYDLKRKENDASDDRGLGAWQDRKTWHTSEWEERRVRGLELIAQLGGLAQPDQVQASDTLGHFEEE